MPQEKITIGFDTDKNDVVHVSTLEYEMDTVPPEITIRALHDLARDEERSYREWYRKREMEEDLQKRRN